MKLDVFLFKAEMLCKGLACLVAAIALVLPL